MTAYTVRIRGIHQGETAHIHLRTVGKVSTDKPAQNFSRYWVISCTPTQYWCILALRIPQYKKSVVNNAELFELTISTDLSHS